MDLAIGAKNVYVMMNLFAKDGTPKLVPECTYPLTGLRCVSRVYTEYATFGIDRDAGIVGIHETFGITTADLATRMNLELQWGL
jgi:3-oxoadipate CoA-transferase beta subunit